MIEFLVAGLGVTTGIAGLLAYIYRRGKSDGIDSACEIRIKDEIKKIKKSADEHAKDDIIVHQRLNKKIDIVDSKIDKLVGSVDVIKSIVTKSKE